MNLYSLLDNTTILSNANVSDKEELLNLMIDTLKEKVEDGQLHEIRKSVFERERIMSTGVGKSLAIPHGKVSFIDENLASFAILKEPIEFDSIDEKPVKMAFLLVGPEKKNSVHIKLLSRISRLMNSVSFRDTLLACNSSDEILDVFEQEEIKYFGN